MIIYKSIYLPFCFVFLANLLLPAPAVFAGRQDGKASSILSLLLIHGKNDNSYTVKKSMVYPYGLEYQLHGNSKSVNTPPYSSNLMDQIGNTGTNNDCEIPLIKSAESFNTKIYFDSAATNGGDGTIENPYNNLDIITNEDYPNDCALLLKSNSIFFLSGLKASSAKNTVYIGSYGEGNMPIVSNLNSFEEPTDFSPYWFEFTGDNITIDGIHIVGGSNNIYGRLVSIGGTNITIANSHLESVKTEAGYIFNIFKGGAENFILYHNEIAYAKNDIWYASSNGSYKIVSNYFHHANAGTYDSGSFDPQDRDTWVYSTGDIIQFEYENLDGAYIANNFFDRSDSAAKFALIFNGSHTNKNVIVEYNTFIGPLAILGGAALQWHTDGILRKNLVLNVDQQGGVTGLASYKTYADEIKGNHFVGYTEDSAFYNLSYDDLDNSNKVYLNLKLYKDTVKPDERLGSSIFSK